MRLGLFASLLPLAFISLPARAATTFSSVALSPDSHTLASVRTVDGHGELHLTELPSGTDKVIGPSAATPCSNTFPVWAPDGHTLAFTSTCGTPASSPNPHQEQIFLYTPATGQTRQLTHLTGNLDDLSFSPDSRSLAFLFVQNATRSAGALDAMKPWSGVIGEDGIEPQRVALANLQTGAVLEVTPASLHAFEFSWAPDSRSLALVAAPNPGENNWWIAKLYRADLALTSSPSSDHLDSKLHVVLDPNTVAGPLHGLQIAVPRISPDGQSIAFLGGLMSDQGSTGGDVYLVPSTGGTPRNLTPDRPATPTWLAWLPASVAPHTLLVSEDAQASTHLFRLNAETGQPEPADDLHYPGSLHAGGIKDALSVSSNGTIAAIASSFSDPPELVTLAPDSSALTPVTHLNDALKGTGTRTESVQWTSDSFHVQGWLTFPAHFDPARRYPVLVVVHGGPSASIRSTWSQQSTFADAGYFVLQPNPRGSFGQGEHFTEANRKDFGYGDLRDILAGLDTVEKQQPIDKAREGLTGWSYGGFMTMFAVTQTHRFHAAIAGAGISDWQSYYGENSIDQWMTPFFGATVYDDPAVYAKSSAIDFIKQVTTPTLVIVGDRDGECPAPQSFEFWHALRAENVPTQLVIYPAEGHRFSNPEHIADRTRRELAWFSKYLPATTSAPQATAGN